MLLEFIFFKDNDFFTLQAKYQGMLDKNQICYVIFFIVIGDCWYS